MIPNEVQLNIISKCESADLFRWCCSDLEIRELAMCPTVWQGRRVNICNQSDMLLAFMYKDFIEWLDLSAWEYLQTIYGFKNLKRLCLSRSEYLTDEGLLHVLKANTFHLECIDFSQCLELTNKSLYMFHSESLKKANLRGTLFTNSGLSSFLENCPNLDSLNISSCLLINREALNFLPSKLIYLNISGNDWVNFSFLKDLCSKSPKLECVNVNRCEELTIAQIHKLKELYPRIEVISDAKIYDDSPESIRTYLMSMISTQ